MSASLRSAAIDPGCDPASRRIVQLYQSGQHGAPLTNGMGSINLIVRCLAWLPIAAQNVRLEICADALSNPQTPRLDSGNFLVLAVSSWLANPLCGFDALQAHRPEGKW